jgi:hypothetical protein
VTPTLDAPTATAPPAAGSPGALRLVNPDPRYAPIALGTPSTRGYLHIGASAHPGRVPLVLPNAERSALLVRLKELAHRLVRSEAALAATVFRAVVIPPTTRMSPYLRQRGAAVLAPRFDVAVLIETESPAAARELQDTPELDALLDAVRGNARTVHVLAARNEKRFGEVDESAPGLFLFNHFVADDPRVGLALWDHLAGWYAAETGLDNSLLLVPLEGERSAYAFVNHARWDAAPGRVLWEQLTKPTFRRFVLANLEANRAGALPVLYRRA